MAIRGKTVSVLPKTVSVFQKTVSVFLPVRFRWRAMKYQLAGNEASVGGRRGKPRARARIQADLKSCFHLSHENPLSLCIKGFQRSWSA